MQEEKSLQTAEVPVVEPVMEIIKVEVEEQKQATNDFPTNSDEVIDKTPPPEPTLVEGELHPAVEETLIKLLVGSLLLINCSGDCVGSSQGEGKVDFVLTVVWSSKIKSYLILFFQLSFKFLKWTFPGISHPNVSGKHHVRDSHVLFWGDVGNKLKLTAGSISGFGFNEGILH
ncbi:hypothetical protein CKAN_02426900 [Cinnamomum micranthum f. kanehirae]|uniref:Uncharacterized protein n=1 Tax=Cinnamomum micranthum f. kanehirae TaxID=337451 RepID=A0A3S3R3P5_9MAGN|nr:hypothetical protein CKAN_02426900 [Cinnamomum micranthum f. kanehirae]